MYAEWEGNQTLLFVRTWKPYYPFLDTTMPSCVRVCFFFKSLPLLYFQVIYERDLNQVCMHLDLHYLLCPNLPRRIFWVSLWLWAQGTPFYVLLILATVTSLLPKDLTEKKLMRQEISFGSILESLSPLWLLRTVGSHGRRSPCGSWARSRESAGIGVRS